MEAGPRTWRVVEFARSVRWEDLPPRVRSQAIRCVLDLCRAAVAGSGTQLAHSAVSYALYAHGNGPSTIIGTSATSTPVGAALANGFAASALDVDDGYRPKLPRTFAPWLHVRLKRPSSALPGLSPAP